MAVLPSAEFPDVTAAADWLCTEASPEWAFVVALDLLIGGLERLLEDPERRSLPTS